MKYEYSFILRILFCFIPVKLFTFILTPITLYLSYLTLIFYNPIVSGNSLIIRGIPFQFIEACIASYAYYLIILLTLLTKDVRFFDRIKILLLGSLLILIMNVFRIFILIYLVMNFGFYWFDLIHMIFWKFVSGIYVALVWILLVKYFKINSIPIYSDLKYLFKNSLFKR